MRTKKIGGELGCVQENVFLLLNNQLIDSLCCFSKCPPIRLTLCFFLLEFRFDVSNDALLQDEPLIFKVCDSDTLSSDESIGLVYIDLNPLLTQTATVNDSLDDEVVPRTKNSDSQISGWFPLYDTLGGVRGELELSVKLNFIGDVNPFRDSSAGVQLFPFSTLDPSSGFSVAHIFGFVEELVVADDPEFFDNNNNNSSSFSAISKKSSKISHETRQTLLYLLDAAVRRKMCKTVLDKGGNAVLGYHQNFDMEGDSGIVARTYGTCVRLERRQHPQHQHPHHSLLQLKRHRKGSTHRSTDDEIQTDSEREEDEDDHHSPTTATAGRRSTFATMAIPDPDDDEVQLLTLRDFDPRVRVRIGGLVTARSVKYLGNLASKLSDQEQRDSWWTELRDEIRSHAKILCCSHVIGYLEASTIHEDVAVLSITGTACTVRGLPDIHLHNQPRLWGSYPDPALLDSTEGVVMSTSQRKAKRLSHRSGRASRKASNDGDLHTGHSISQDGVAYPEVRNHMDYKGGKRFQKGHRITRVRDAKPCSYCHVPYHHRLAPFTNMKLVPCMLCGKKWVPEVVLATCEPPARLPIRGPGVFIQARVCRSRPPEKNSESDSLAVSEALPFLEYELARQLMLK